MYKACANQADYTIDPKDRKAGKLQTAEDGEEIGVTMLHMYLIVVRFRCLEPTAQQAFQAQLVNHFFYQAEAKMEDVHELTSRMIRQKYLKDVFVQWRGLILAYDEGLVKGDAVLASAVWRNLFKAREDVDVRALAAVVSWIRAGISRMAEMEDGEVEVQAQRAFPLLINQFGAVDLPTASLKAAIEKATVAQATVRS
ncbi:Mitochondrial beta-keto-acyl synthase [Collariella sp. IMI 366227]|nr:Mitochondrial beta-keto-acyl synthase [Collariella sp. IMI 366227]